MESTPQSQTERACEGVKELQDDLHFYRKYSQGQVDDYFKLFHCFKKMKKYYEKLLEEDDLVKGPESISFCKCQISEVRGEKPCKYVVKEEKERKLTIKKEEEPQALGLSIHSRKETELRVHDLLRQLEDAAKEKSALRSHYEKKLKDLNSVVSKREEDNRRLQKEKEDLVRAQEYRKVSSRKQISEITTDQEGKHRLQVRIKEEEGENVGLKRSIPLLSDTEKRVRELRSQLEEAVKEKSALCTDYEHKVSELTSVVSSGKQDYEKLLEENKKLCKQVTAMRFEIQQLDSDMLEMVEKMRFKDEEIQELKANVLLLDENDTMVQELQCQLDETNKEKSSMSSDYQQKISELLEENDYLYSQVTDLMAKIEQLELDIEAKDQQLRDKERVMKDLEYRVMSQGENERRTHELQRQLEEATVEKNTLRCNYEERLGELSSVVSNGQNSYSDLLKQVEKLCSEASEREVRMEQMGFDLHEKDKQLRNKEVEVQDLESSLQLQREESMTILLKRCDQLDKLLRSWRQQM